MSSYLYMTNLEFKIVGMEWNNHDIHGLMVLNLSLNVQSNQEPNLGKGLTFQTRKEPYGGMLIVIGQEPRFMVHLLYVLQIKIIILFLNLLLKFPSY